MIPLSLVLAIIQLLTKLLEAWNALKPEQREAIVDRWLKDDDKRRSDWEKFKGWMGGLFARVGM